MPDGVVGQLIPNVPANPDVVNMYQASPATWFYDIDPVSGLSRATYIGEAFVGGTAAGNQIATKADIAAATTGVSSFNTRTGAVTFQASDVTSVGGALLASPSFTGTPQVPTASPGTSTTQAASTAFVGAAIGTLQASTVASFNGRTGTVTLATSDIVTAGGAPAASPALTGTPTGPTAAIGAPGTSQLATTQFVYNAIGGAVVSWNGRTGAVTLTLSDVTSVGGAPIASPSMTGVPSAPTAAPGTATTQLATTAYVMNAVTAASSGVASFNGRTGTVTLQAADVSGVGGALLAGPAFTGNPTAPTQTAGTNNTTLATTAFVATALTTNIVNTFNGRTGTVTLQAADVTGVGGALTTSPTFTGTPSAPTPPVADNSTRLATTAFVATSFAPLASPTFTGAPSLPAGAVGVTQAPGDNDTSLATTAFVQAAVAPAYNDVGRNLLHNAQFNIQQRGTGPWNTNNAYTADRWLLNLVNDTLSAQIIAAIDAERAAVGDEAMTSYLRLTFTGSATTNSYSQLMQRIENVRRTSNKTVILSFWANAGAPLTLGIQYVQSFGTGGSPSAPVFTTLQTVALTTTFTRYTVVTAVPSIAGKTFGTSGADYLQPTFFTSIQGAGIVQSGAVNIWGVQLEIAQSGQTTPTPLEKLDPVLQLQQCQRFYQIGGSTLSSYAATAGANAWYWPHVFPVTPRASPTVTVTPSGGGGWSSVNSVASTTAVILIPASTAAATMVAFNYAFTASADL